MGNPQQREMWGLMGTVTTGSASKQACPQGFPGCSPGSASQPASREQQEKENALTLFSLVFPEFLVGVGDWGMLGVMTPKS